MMGFDKVIAYDLKVEDSNLRYYRSGKGDTILLIHGITSYSFIWIDVFEKLSQHYDVIAVDLFGCGHSEKSVLIDHSLKNHARLMWKFLDQLQVEKAHIVGHDVGGGISQIMMVSAPQRIHSLILLNSVANDFWPVQPITAVRTPVIRQMAMASLDLGVFRMMISKGLFHKEKVDKDMVDTFNVPMQTKEGRKAFLHFASCLNNQNLLEIEEQLRGTQSPVLIIRGDNDIYLSSSMSDWLHAEIPDSKLIRMPDAGHYAMLDEPEQLAEIILEFLKSLAHE